MITNCYESIFIFRPELAEEKVKELSERFMAMVQKKGAKVLETNLLGPKLLAYRIGKHTRGTYMQARFEGDGASVDELERNLRISEDVIRFLTIREVQDKRVKPRPKKQAARHGD